MRESLGVVDELLAAIRRDATNALTSEQVRLTYLAVQRRPILRALFARDDDVLGEPARGPDADPVHQWRGELAAASSGCSESPG